jgi:hypothetical protein
VLLPVLLETIQPDVIIGTETWLTKDIGNGEFFPAELGFDVIRRDREGDAHGCTNCIETGRLKSPPSRKMWFLFLLLRFCISVMVLSTYLMSCLLGL